ncbi:MAG: hypothetical protein IJ865_09550 [Clostridia bacterium]|nr:hypothetical protein [Clostridia bacterium]
MQTYFGAKGGRILCASLLFSLILACLPLPYLALLGLVLLSFALPLLFLTGMHVHPQGMDLRYLGAYPPFRLLTPHDDQRLMVEERLLLGDTSWAGEILLPEGTCEVSRIRSLPQGILLSAALCIACDTLPSPDSLRSLFPEMNLHESRFRRQYPVLSSAELCGQKGVIVRDGNSARAYFLIESGDAQVREAFLTPSLCVPEKGRVRAIRDHELSFYSELPQDCLLCFTANADLTQLTLLGAVRIHLRQALNASIVSHAQRLQAQGIEVFTGSPLSVPESVEMEPSPLPCHSPGNCLSLAVTEAFPDNEDALMHAVQHAGMQTGVLCHFALFYALAGLFLAFSAWNMHLPVPIGPLLLLIPYLWRIPHMTRPRAECMPDTGNALRLYLSLVPLLTDLLIVSFLPDLTLVQQTAHLFLLALLLAALFPCDFLKRREACVVPVLIIACAVILAACLMRSLMVIFLMVLASLCALTMLWIHLGMKRTTHIPQI